MTYYLSITDDQITELQKHGNIELETIYIEDSNYVEIEIQPILKVMGKDGEKVKDRRKAHVFVMRKNW